MFLWQFVKVLSVKINPELVLDTDILVVTCLSTEHCTNKWVVSNVLIKSWLVSIDGNTCFDHHGYQQGDETGSRWYGGGKNPANLQG